VSLLSLAALGVFASAASASEGAAGAPREYDLVLESPRAGETLRAGELARLAWRLNEASLPEFREWEVFLSLDGGRTHPIRLTPHLGASRREFDFLVPSTPTDDARLLLRFGDERTETEVELPARFAIVGTAVEVATARAFAVGESARPGESGVVLWAEGSRDGSRVREFEYTELPLRISGYSFAAPAALPPALRAAAPRAVVQSTPCATAYYAAMAVPVAPAPSRLAPADLLVRLRRFNV